MPDLTMDQLAALLFSQKLLGIGPLAQAPTSRLGGDNVDYAPNTDIPQSDLYARHYDGQSFDGEAGTLTRAQRDQQDALGYVGLTDDGHIRPEVIDAQHRIQDRQDRHDEHRAEQVATQTTQVGQGGTGRGGTTKRI